MKETVNWSFNFESKGWEKAENGFLLVVFLVVSDYNIRETFATMRKRYA